nr:MAG TPA: hypothetical protein [Bacteriophage sp.]
MRPRRLQKSVLVPSPERCSLNARQKQAGAPSL